MKAPAAAGDGDRGWSAPAIWRPARGYALAMVPANADRDLDHRRHDCNAPGIAHNAVGDCFVRSCHDFGQDVSRGIDTLVDIGFILVIGGPSQAGEEQHDGGQR